MIKNRGTIGEISKDGENVRGVSVEVGVCNTLEAGNAVSDRNVTVSVSALREPLLCEAAGGGYVVDGPATGGDGEVRTGGDVCRRGCSMGSVSARSTTVLKSSTKASHAISFVSPAPADAIVRIMML
jgi:hypothetical protein